MKYLIEWRYLAGRQPNGAGFHYTEFRKGNIYCRHWSVNGKFYEDEQEMRDSMYIKTPQFSYWFHPVTWPIEHKISGMDYISIPKVTDGITEAWFDHQKVNEVGSNWEWIGCTLDCGITIMACWRPEYQYCDLTFNNQTMVVTCLLDKDEIFIPEVGMHLILDDTQLQPPTTRNIVYTPTHGRPYSEWVFDIVSRGQIIGKGIREKTFKEV